MLDLTSREARERKAKADKDYKKYRITTIGNLFYEYGYCREDQIFEIGAKIEQDYYELEIEEIKTILNEVSKNHPSFDTVWGAYAYFRYKVKEFKGSRVVKD